MVSEFIVDLYINGKNRTIHHNAGRYIQLYRIHKRVVCNFKLTTMILCMTLKDKIDIVFQILGFIVSAITLALAWIIMKHFQKQEISIKQLEKVTDLIDYINNHKIGFLFGRTGGHMYSGDFIEMSLFEIKNMEFNDKEFLSSPILLDEKTRGIIDISNYVNNPFIPRDISEELKNFNSWMGTAIYSSDIDKESKESGEISAVVLKANVKSNFQLFNNNNKEKPLYVAYGAFSCIDWNNFKECSFNLERSIKNWLKKYNIDDIKLIE